MKNPPVYFYFVHEDNKQKGVHAPAVAVAGAVSLRAAVKKIALRIQKDRPRYSIGLKWLSSCESRLFFLFFDWIKWTIFVKLIWNHEKTPTSTRKPAKSCKSRLRRIFCLIYQWDFAFRDKFTGLRMAPIFEDWNNKKDRPRENDLFDRSSQAQVAFTPKKGYFNCTRLLAHPAEG